MTFSNETRVGFVLSMALMLAIALIVLTSIASFDARKDAQNSQLEQQLQALLPDHYTNDPINDAYSVIAPELSINQAATVYPIWQGANAAGVITTAIAPDGYNGDIHLLIGFDENGNVRGVRVSAHRETPGLGDDIDTTRSDWVYAFDNLALNTLNPESWHVKKYGGEFDQFTGATITPQAIVRAVERATRWYQTQQSTLMKTPLQQHVVGQQTLKPQPVKPELVNQQ